MSEKHILCGFDVPEFEKRMKMLLKERGYVLKNAMAADLFPRCAHVESIVCLCRQ